LQNKIVHYKKTVECRHLIFWQGSRWGFSVILQNWGRIAGFQLTRFSCKSLFWWLLLLYKFKLSMKSENLQHIIMYIILWIHNKICFIYFVCVHVCTYVQVCLVMCVCVGVGMGVGERRSSSL
jgi:hypothetical protein